MDFLLELLARDLSLIQLRLFLRQLVFQIVHLSFTFFRLLLCLTSFVFKLAHQLFLIFKKCLLLLEFFLVRLGVLASFFFEAIDLSLQIFYASLERGVIFDGL